MYANNIWKKKNKILDLLRGESFEAFGTNCFNSSGVLVSV